MKNEPKNLVKKRLSAVLLPHPRFLTLPSRFLLGASAGLLILGIQLVVLVFG